MQLRLIPLVFIVLTIQALAGQVPGGAQRPDISISHRDRFYTADQFSNTVSVVDPADNKLLGLIKLGDPVPGNLSPLYRGQLLVHGMGFSPDHRTLAVVSIGSNSVTFIDTSTNTVKHFLRMSGVRPRSVFHPRRPRGLGKRSRRKLCLCSGWQDVQGEAADYRAERAWNDRSSLLTPSTATSVQASRRRRLSFHPLVTRSLDV